MAALCDAAVRGVGITQLPGMIVNEGLKAGVMVELLPDRSRKRERIHAVFPSWRGLRPLVRALLDYLVERMPDLDAPR